MHRTLFPKIKSDMQSHRHAIINDYKENKYQSKRNNL